MESKTGRKAGFLGLGWMGSHFAGRLLQAGQALTVFDVLPERTAAVAEAGGRPADSDVAVVRESSVVFTSLRSSEVFEQVAESVLLPHARPGQVFVDLGTTRLEPTRTLGAALAERGATLLDAPVSGDPRRPVYMFVGGAEEAFRQVRPLLEILADPAHLTWAGPGGAGQILKGVNQLAMGLVQAAWLETISYGTRQGLDPETVGRAVGGETGWRAALAQAAHRVAEGRAEQDDLKFAELPYFLDAAERAGMPLPLTRALFEFCDPGPREWQDNMNRPYVSFWHMLHPSASVE